MTNRPMESLKDQVEEQMSPSHAHVVGWQGPGEEWSTEKVRHAHYGGDVAHYHDFHPALAYGDDYLPKSMSCPFDERKVSHRDSGEKKEGTEAD